jgi:HD-like signal output (HDOD) protein
LAKRFGEALGEAGQPLDAVCSAAMLHECGRLVLLSNFEQRYTEALERARANGDSATQAEIEEFGVPHGRIGGFILSLWGLPKAIVDAVAFHDWPSRAGGPGEPSLAVTHAACALAHDPDSESLDVDFLRFHRLDGQIVAWRRIASRFAGERL